MNSKGETPLLLAIRYYLFDLITEVIAVEGVDVNLVGEECRLSPLELAVSRLEYYPDMDIVVDLLLEKGALLRPYTVKRDFSLVDKVTNHISMKPKGEE